MFNKFQRFTHWRVHQIVIVDHKWVFIHKSNLPTNLTQVASYTECVINVNKDKTKKKKQDVSCPLEEFDFDYRINR